MPNVSIASNSEIQENCFIGKDVFIGSGSKVKKNVYLSNGTTVLENIFINDYFTKEIDLPQLEKWL